MTPILFSSALLCGAALLFWVQLFLSKMLLPILGGSPSVWNTCTVFFQVSLLLGYFYAYASERWLSERVRYLLHPILLLFAACVLPITVQGLTPPTSDANPIVWLLKALSGLVAAPFVVLAGTAPMLQAWYSRLAIKTARDPYFLYAASNIGSLAALVAYPIWIEPHLRLSQQSQIWMFGYFALIGLTAACALRIYKDTHKAVPNEVLPVVNPFKPDAQVTVMQRLRWILLAFIPSSLLLGVTTHLTMDVASVPLFWVVPLVLYLLSFVLAFQKILTIPMRLVSTLQASFLIIVVLLAFYSTASEAFLSLFIHLIAFFMTALLCHMELVRMRPEIKELTSFYLFVSLGGALGGAFNALVAPVIFNQVFEYPLVLILACLVRPGTWPNRRDLKSAVDDIIFPVLLFLILFYKARAQHLSAPLFICIVLAVPIATFVSKSRPIRFALCIAAIIFSSVGKDDGHVLARARNFYGVLSVMAEMPSNMHSLYSGTTLHGSQSQNSLYRLRPTSYYFSTGPLGQLFDALKDSPLTHRVGLVGLGAGTTACYGKAGEQWTFFEINQADVNIAKNPDLFTYFGECPVHADIVMGDARLSIQKQPDNSFGMLVFDAFSSDSIPVHLMTKEAVEMYLTKLQPGGLLVFHVSNRHLHLVPVLANIASSLRLFLRDWDDLSITNEEYEADKKSSEWVLLAKSLDDFQPLAGNENWATFDPVPEMGVWTDDYSNIWSVIYR